MFGSNGEVGRHNTSKVDGPALIVGRKGSIGKIHYSKAPSWPIDTTYYIDESCSDWNLKFLFYLLRYLDLHKMNKAAAIPGLNRNDVYDLNVMPYSLEKQNLFVERIEKISNSGNLYLQSQQKLAELFSSLQHKAFSGELSGAA